MRKEHTSHVIVVSLMLLFVLGVFAYVIIKTPKGFTPGITTSLPYSESTQTNQVQQINTDSSAKQTQMDVLVSLLILLAFLGVVYITIKISRELKKPKQEA